MLQAAGRPDLVAKVNLVELPVYLAVIAWTSSVFGIASVAAVWTIRTGLNLAVLLILTRRVVGADQQWIGETAMLVRVGGIGLLVLDHGCPLSFGRGPSLQRYAISLFFVAGACGSTSSTRQDQDRIRSLLLEILNVTGLAAG